MSIWKVVVAGGRLTSPVVCRYSSCLQRSALNSFIVGWTYILSRLRCRGPKWWEQHIEVDRGVTKYKFKNRFDCPVGNLARPLATARDLATWKHFARKSIKRHLQAFQQLWLPQFITWRKYVDYFATNFWLSCSPGLHHESVCKKGWTCWMISSSNVCLLNWFSQAKDVDR